MTYKLQFVARYNKLKFGRHRTDSSGGSGYRLPTKPATTCIEGGQTQASALPSDQNASVFRNSVATRNESRVANPGRQASNSLLPERTIVIASDAHEVGPET